MELLDDPMGRREFMTYLEKEFSGKGERQECTVSLCTSCILMVVVDGLRP